MREISLRPVYDYEKYHEHIQAVLDFELYYHIFAPLFEIMGVPAKREHIEIKEGSRWNAPGSALRRALESGVITYSEHYFYGTFNAAISKELRSMGARFDNRNKSYRLELGRVPMDLKTAIVQSRIKIKQRADDLQRKIDELSKTSLTVDLGMYVKNVLGDLDTQFVRTVKPNLEVPMQMSDGVRDQLAEDYNTNMNLYIQGWKEEQIQRLRDQVNQAVIEGFRADSMLDTIQAEYGVTKRKARFLARQETSLLVSKYREARYTEAGLKEYKWSTSHDERVRPDHKVLDKRHFSWDSPPVVDTATGRRANPGEDFGCRCVAIPVLRIGG
jgi:SPP1 gp7 family putative phage head morphogenesis protein